MSSSMDSRASSVVSERARARMRADARGRADARARGRSIDRGVGEARWVRGSTVDARVRVDARRVRA